MEGRKDDTRQAAPWMYGGKVNRESTDGTIRRLDCSGRMDGMIGKKGWEELERIGMGE